MKKIVIITGILLLAVTVSAQQSNRERARQNNQNHKSEATTRRTVQNRRIESPAGRTNQNPRPEVKARHSQPDRKIVASPSRTVKNRANEPGVSGKNGTDRKVVASPSRTAQNRANEPGVAGRSMGQVHREVTRNPGSNAARNERKTADPARIAEQRRNYTTPNRMNVRNSHGVKTHTVPVKYNKIHYNYRAPRRVHVIWTNRMYREYRLLYPEFRYWYYPAGYRIITVPAYKAYFHIGEVRNVYGRVHQVWYSWTTDEYYLYFGGTYPYQDFTVILPGRDARRFNRFPEAFFEGRYIWVTGLVSTFEGKPEIMVKRNSQVHLY